MVTRRVIDWLIILTVMSLLTLIPLYNGYRAYLAVDSFIRDLPMILADYVAEHDSRETGEGTTLAAQDVADDSSVLESSFLNTVLLYDVRSFDGDSLSLLLFAQGLPICRVTDGGLVALPTTGDVSLPFRQLESLRRHDWLQAPARYTATIFEAFFGASPIDLTALLGSHADQ
jgi:hypothetical protein